MFSFVVVHPHFQIFAELLQTTKSYAGRVILTVR